MENHEDGKTCLDGKYAVVMFGAGIAILMAAKMINETSHTSAFIMFNSELLLSFLEHKADINRLACNRILYALNL